jgi:mannose/fructose/N-acetylgalactosamine-specific phosphotransferase system component IID
MGIKFALPVGAAIALSIPFGIMGALLNNARRAFAGVFWRMSQGAIEERKYNKIWTYGFLFPQIMNFVSRFLPVFLLLFLFGKAGGDAIKNMPGWLTSAFTIMGTMLPGVGIVLCLSIMGSRSLLPYAVIGFFLLGRFSFVMVEAAIAGIVFGMIHTVLKPPVEDENAEDEEEFVPVKGMFSTLQICIWYYKYSLLYRQSQCMEYFYGTGNAMVMMGEMKKIYGDNADGLQAGMKRALEPYITHPSTGSWMLTAQFAMEEDIARNGDPDGEKGKAISAMKTGFMGPFAGIGDTIWGSVTLPIVRSFSYATYLTGSWAGLIPIFLYNTFSGIVMGFVSSVIGYRAGINTILKIIDTALFKRVLTIAIITGMVTMGALSASYVIVKTKVVFTTTITTTDDKGVQQKADVKVNLQDKLNMIMPNLLTFLYMGMLIWMQFTGKKTTTMMLVSVGIAFAGALIGFF